MLKLRQICPEREVARTPAEHYETPLAVILVPYDQPGLTLLGGVMDHRQLAAFAERHRARRSQAVYPALP